MAFDQRELRAFLAVAEYGSLSRAAAAASMSQPALSRLVQQMERRFGQPLFDRHGKGMTLTQAGDVLASYAKLLLSEMEHASDALNFLTGHNRGLVRVGADASATYGILPAAVRKLKETLPGVKISAVEAADGQLVEALANRSVDIIITPELPPHEEIMPARRCHYEDVLEVFCSTDHPLAGKKPTLREALAYGWVMPGRGTSPRNLFETLVRRAGGVEPQVTAETSSVLAILSFVLNSKLLGWLPEPLMGDKGTGVMFNYLHIEELALRRSFFVYCRRRGILPSAAQQFLRMIPSAPLSDTDID